MSVNRVKSDWALVTIRIPQGSILGSMLFIIFRNNLPMAKMFADDTKVFRPLRGEEDQQHLQDDIDNLVT